MKLAKYLAAGLIFFIISCPAALGVIEGNEVFVMNPMENRENALENEVNIAPEAEADTQAPCAPSAQEAQADLENREDAPVSDAEADEFDETEEDSEDDEAEPKKPAKKKKSLLREIREWVVSLVVAVLAVFLLRTFVFQIIEVDGPSMNHTLANGERLYVSVLTANIFGYDRGDVVICHYPGRESEFKLGSLNTGIMYDTYFVKRIVAVPGDTVYRTQGVTYVEYTDENGQTVTEALDAQYPDVRRMRYDYAPYTLGEDEYFVVGDNRGDSHDSRDWNDSNSPDPNDPNADLSADVGPISRDMLVGKVRFVLWPFGDIRTVK